MRPGTAGRVPGAAWLLSGLLLVPAFLFSGPVPTWAQASKVFKIGILTLAMAPWHSHTQGFRDGLKELGLVEGKNVVFEARAVQGDASRLAQMGAELLQQKPDLLYCVGSASTQACSQVTRTTPIVFAEVGDPVRLDLVKSLARPGGNVTGMANLRAELTAKRLEIFKETVPSLRRVLITYDPREREEVEAVEVARSAAGSLGLTLIERQIKAPLEIEPGLAELKEGGRDGILIVQSGANLNIGGRSLEVATSNSLPTMYPAAFWTKFGALISYGPDQYEQGRQGARLAHKILAGTPPRELPVELPERIDLVVNLKTAKRLGLRIPQAVLLRADRVIE